MSEEKTKQLNVRIPEWVHTEAKVISVKKGRSLQYLIAEIIEIWVNEQMKNETLEEKEKVK